MEPRDLAVDTAVSRLKAAPGWYTANLPAGWNFRTPCGGVLITVAMRAMQEELNDPDLRPLSANTHFCSPVPDGPLEVRVEVLRHGGAAAQVRAQLSSTTMPGPGLEVSATFGRLRQGVDVIRTLPPPAAAPRWLPRSSAAALLTALAALALPAAAAYPDKPIRLIVGQQPGSALDNAVRVITPPLSESLGQQVVVDNRAGAGGMIAMQIGLAAAPDGYTLVNAGSPQMIAPFLFRNLDYDLFRDFVPVARLTVTQNALVAPPSLAVADVRSLIALLKARPGELNLASAGVGSASHLAGELFNAMTGVRAVHVPYKGGAAAVTALLGNEAQ